MKKLTRIEMKKIKGGLMAPPASCCSVTCGNGDIKERECGSGTTCSTNGTKVCCGNDGCIDLCTATV